MIAIIKYSGGLVTFKMKDTKSERLYIKRFLEVSEDTNLDLGKFGKFPKKDVINMICVKNEEEAKAFHKATLSILKRIFIQGK